MALASGIYRGWVRHRRYTPAQNNFKYRVYMMYLDLDELEKVFSMSPLWSLSGWAPALFRRSDFHGDPAIPLKESVHKTVFEKTGERIKGPVRMLANLRYFGYNTNPLCTYYCFDEQGESLRYIVAEVTNTPWGERHAYVLPCAGQEKKQNFCFDKRFHVSPFNELNMEYHWRSCTPGKNLLLHIENWREGKCIMDASMVLQRQSLSAHSLNRIVVHFPFMTVKVIAAIYWQAVKLFLKKVPYVHHPHNDVAASSAPISPPMKVQENLK